ARSVVESVFDGQFELGFVGGRWSRSGLRFDSVYSDAVVLVAPPDHPLTTADMLTLADLAGVPFIVQEPGAGLRGTLERELEARGIRLRDHVQVVAELGNQESVKSAVAAGFGIGCVWRASAGSDLAAGVLRELAVTDFVPDATYHVVRRTHHQLTRRSQALLDY